MHQVGPLGISVGVFLEVQTQAVAEVFGAQHEGELLQHARSLGVDNRAVGGFRVAQIRDVLINRRRALRGVDGIGGRLVRFVEALPDILIGLQGGQRLVGHVLRRILP